MMITECVTIKQKDRRTNTSTHTLNSPEIYLTGTCIPLSELARFWFSVNKSISRGETEGNMSGQWEPESC